MIDDARVAGGINIDSVVMNGVLDRGERLFIGGEANG